MGVVLSKGRRQVSEDGKRALGVISRRGLVKGIAVLPLAHAFSLPAWAQEDAPLEAEQAVPLPEEIVAAQGPVSLTTQGERPVSGFFAWPETTLEGAKVPTLLLIHDWLGVSDEVKAVAVACAAQGYATLAVDLYEGVVPNDTAAAGFAMRNVVQDVAIDTLVSWVEWLRGHELSNGRVGICGWSSGAGWALALSSVASVDATVLYYGGVGKAADQLTSLSGPTLGHFGRNDVFVNEVMVADFEQAMADADKPLTLHIYDADHGFANSASVRYDEQDAKLAWARSLAFFESHLSLPQVQ